VVEESGGVAEESSEQRSAAAELDAQRDVRLMAVLALRAWAGAGRDEAVARVLAEELLDTSRVETDSAPQGRGGVAPSAAARDAALQQVLPGQLAALCSEPDRDAALRPLLLRVVEELAQRLEAVPAQRQRLRRALAQRLQGVWGAVHPEFRASRGDLATVRRVLRPLAWMLEESGLQTELCRTVLRPVGLRFKEGANGAALLQDDLGEGEDEED